MPQEFIWTDELVKEAIDLIAKRFAYPNNYSNKWEGLDIEFDKFKQSKQQSVSSNKDWEIVHADYIPPFNQQVIKSVRRLSDWEVFSVGDIIVFGGFGNLGNASIQKFDIDTFDNDRIMAYHSGYGLGVSKWRKVKQPLFKTEDGKDIYDNDYCYCVRVSGYQPDWGYYKYFAKHIDAYDKQYKYFSTDAAAKEYIVLNKPCLSIKDIENIFDYAGSMGADSLLKKFRDIVEKRIQQNNG